MRWEEKRRRGESGWLHCVGMYIDSLGSWRCSLAGEVMRAYISKESPWAEEVSTSRPREPRERTLMRLASSSRGPPAACDSSEGGDDRIMMGGDPRGELRG